MAIREGEVQQDQVDMNTIPFFTTRVEMMIRLLISITQALQLRVLIP